MADSNRKTLWLQIIAKLEEIDGVQKVYFGMAPLGETHVAVIPIEDPFTRSSKLTQRSAATFAIRVVVAEMSQSALFEYEDLAPLIKAKMEELRAELKAASGNHSVELVSEKWLYPDAQHSDTGVDLNYVVDYNP